MSSRLDISLVLIAIIALSMMATYYQHLLRISPREIVMVSTGRDRDLVVKLVNEVAEALETVRGLKFTEHIQVYLINTSWAIETWAPKNHTISPEQIYKEMVFKLTFLIPYNMSLARLQTSWVGMFLAGAAGTALFINTDYLNPYDRDVRGVLAHELTHILQYLHFNISYPNTTDSLQALMALIEGDADFTRNLYCIKTALCNPKTSSGLYLGDMYIALNLFPYIFGMPLVEKLYRYGGNSWVLVNAAYGRAPKSTLMVMKPDLYLDYLLKGVDVEVEVVIANASGGYVYSDRLGAYYIMLVLAKFSDLGKAMDIAFNWRGDLILLYNLTTPERNQWRALWNTTWSSPRYAQIFYRNLTVYLRSIGELAVEDNEGTTILIRVSEKAVHIVRFRISGCSVLVDSTYVEERL